MTPRFTTADWEGYLDEAWPDDRMRELEGALRDDPQLLVELEAILRARDAGCHSVAEIWRAARLTCADRNEWGRYLLELLPAERTAYLRFHLDEIGCRYCRANVDDLLAARAANAAVVERRKRYFASSAGLLRKE